MSTHATYTDLRNATGVDTSKLAKKTDWASLKSEVDKLDTDKLEKVTTVVNSLETEVDKLDVDKFVPVPADLIKSSDAVKNYVVKTDVYNAKIRGIQDKIPDSTTLAKIPNSTILAATTTLTSVKNKIPEHNKYITTTEFNKLTAEIFTTRLRQANLATEGDIPDFVKKIDFDDKRKNLN